MDKKKSDYLSKIYYLAETGDTESQKILAYYYTWGSKNLNIKPDDKQAVKFFKILAEKNDPNYQYILAQFYYAKDNVLEYKKWCKLAADQGHKVAQIYLSMSYFEIFAGNGDQNSKENGIKYLKLSADNGRNGARMILAQMYFYGIVVNKDVEKAKEYFKLAKDLQILSFDKYMEILKNWKLIDIVNYHLDWFASIEKIHTEIFFGVDIDPGDMNWLIPS